MFKRTLGIIIIVVVAISFGFYIPLDNVSAASKKPKYTYTCESDNAFGVVIHIKSKSFIKGKIRVTYYMNGKKIQKRVKSFAFAKDTFINVEGPDNMNYGLFSPEKYKVKVYNVKKLKKKKNARKKVATCVKRRPLDEDIDEVTLYIKNNSKKNIKCRGVLVMRYAATDMFGDNRKWEFYDMEETTRVIKPGKTIAVSGVTWSDYKLNYRTYIDAYYTKKKK